MTGVAGASDYERATLTIWKARSQRTFRHLPKPVAELLWINLSSRFDQTVYEVHVERLAPILEDVQPWVLTGHIPHASGATITCFAAGSNTAKDRVFGDNDYVGRGPETPDAVLRPAIPDEHSTW
jgi:hypothetical protein